MSVKILKHNYELENLSDDIRFINLNCDICGKKMKNPYSQSHTKKVLFTRDNSIHTIQCISNLGRKDKRSGL